MPTVEQSTEVDDEELARMLAPRDDLVAEAAAGDGRFTLASGPFDRWDRVVRASPAGPGRHHVHERVDFRLAIPVWYVLFNPLVRRVALKAPEPGAPAPWWSPPDRFEARVSRTIAVLCVFGLMAGYLGTLLTQTNTFFRKEFGASVEDVSWVLTGARIGGFLALLVVASADRRGRRRVLLWSTYAALVLAATAAGSPNLAWLGVSQTAARSFSAAMTLLVAIIAVEEVPKGSRAFAVSVLTLTAALGSGIVVVTLQVGKLAPWAWRIFYVVPLLAIPAARRLGGLFGESRRYELLAREEEAAAHPTDGTPPHLDRERTAARARLATHLGRFAALASTTLLLFLFLQPQSNYLNDFLSTEQAYEPWQISLFQVLTTVPAGLFVVLGGALADRFGRKLVGALGAGLGALFSVLMFNATGWPIWLFSLLSTITAATAVPALGVYGPELFPTSRRGLANGGINLAGTIGVVIGFQVVGRLHEQWGSYAPALTLLGLGPMVAVVIILVFYPETAHLELEELNPEDRPPPDADAGRPAPSEAPGRPAPGAPA